MTTRNPQLEKKLATYTLAGAALLAPGITEAAVVHSGPINITVTQTGSYALDLSGPGTADIVLNAVLAPGFPSGSSENQVNVSTNAGAGILQTSPGSGAAVALAFGDLIDPASANWGSSGKMVGYNPTDPGFSGGDWPSNGNSAYLGFYFGTPGDVNAGWARISTTANAAGSQFTLHSYAYQDTPNTAITAGEGEVPEPSSMALLALGGAGLLALRRRRQQNNA